MITITPAATIAIKDSGISPNPNPVPFAGIPINCPAGAMAQDVLLAANTAAAPLPFPLALATAAFLAIYAATTTDLIVTVDGTDLNVPLEQPLFLYGVAAADISVSTVKGGKITYLVGG